MNNYLKHISVIVVFVFISFYGLGQERITQIENDLNTLTAKVPALNETVDISVNGVSIQEFLRGVANNVKVNINVDPNLNYKVINNFSNVKVKDILLFVCKEYNLKIDILGNIISISQFVESEPVKAEKSKYKIKVVYDKNTNFLNLELTNDTLSSVAKEITKQSGKNIVLASGIGSKKVNGYFQNMPFENVLDKFAFANDLVISKTEDDFYLVEEKVIQSTSVSAKDKNGNEKNTSGKNNKQEYSAEANFEYTITSLDSITINAMQTPIEQVISVLSEKLSTNYMLLSEIKGETNINVENVSFEKLLELLFNGTDYTYKKEKNIYLIGEKKSQDLKSFKVIQLQYRTVEKLSEVVPADLKKDIEIKEFNDLNSLVITGPISQLEKVSGFIREIDKVVPLVLIEVIIVDLNKSHTVTTGITAGLGEGTETKGTLLPGLDMTFSTSSINNLLQNLTDKFTWFNIGKVTPEFYLSLKALEDNNIIKVRSTPKLSTLNGNEATLSSGETRYYYEERSNIISNQSTTTTQERIWKNINADLSITIKPLVSGDGQVTLDIDVQQSDFKDPEYAGAPPGSVNRNFKSLVRVKNNEMILLGGLERKSDGNTGKGVPLLSRVPVLKWFFSSKTKTRSNSTLNIFIKPTVIY